MTGMKDTKNLVKRLKSQIAEAREVDGDFAYITVGDAKRILKLLEREQVKPEIEGGGCSWWYVCSECHGAIDSHDRFCRHCGGEIQKDG